MQNLTFIRRASITAGVAASLLLTLAPVAGAGLAGMSIDPTSGPAGTTITVTSDGGCYPGDDTLQVTLTPGFTGAPYAGGATPIATVDGVLSDNDAGSWTVSLPVPASAAPGSYTVDARCDYVGPRLTGRALRAQSAGFNYGSLEFQVTASTTTTTVETTTTTTPATTTTVAPPAAQAVQARPTYTG